MTNMDTPEQIANEITNAALLETKGKKKPDEIHCGCAGFLAYIIERDIAKAIASERSKAEERADARVANVMGAIGKSCVNDCRDPDGRKCAAKFLQDGKTCICFCHKAYEAAVDADRLWGEGKRGTDHWNGDEAEGTQSDK